MLATTQKIMKNVSQSVASYTLRHSRQVALIAIAVVMLVAALIPAAQERVLADQYDSQINALQAQNAANQSALLSLEDQAKDYTQSIERLQSQINTLETEIQKNKARQADLERQIKEAQDEIDRQREILAIDIKAMYVDGTPSSLEMLAASKNLSDFVDKQEYRSRIQQKLQDTLETIAELQRQLQEQKAEIESLLKEMAQQQAALDADRAQQQELLNYNESQQAAYTARVQANNAELAKLRAAQAAALAAVTGSNGSSPTGSVIKYKNFTTSYSLCGGGYSYCWAYYDQWVNDPWGLGWAHECVHYVADWLERHGYNVPRFSGDGNANLWSRKAPTVSSPQRGDVVYMPLAWPGHVGIVERVNSDGTVHVSQMNWPIGGYYSEMDLYITPGIQFLRFPKE